MTAEFDGCRFFYELSGDGPPILFIQGVGVHGSGWTPQVSALSAEFSCLTFDNRGIGRSQPQAVALSVAKMAHDAIHLMEHVGWQSAHLVGHSMGGPIAIQVALLSRHRVRSLSLLCTVGRGRDATRLTGRMLILGALSRLGPRRLRRRAFLQIVMSKNAFRSMESDAVAAQLEPIFGHDLADQPPVALKQLAALRAFDASGSLAQLAGIPTLVVSAEQDPVAPPAFGAKLAQGIPGAQYVEIPDASHGVTIQCAEIINGLLRRHIVAADLKQTDSM